MSREGVENNSGSSIADHNIASVTADDHMGIITSENDTFNGTRATNLCDLLIIKDDDSIYCRNRPFMMIV